MSANRRTIRASARLVVLAKDGTLSHHEEAADGLRGAWDGRPGEVVLVRLDDGRDVLVHQRDLAPEAGPCAGQANFTNDSERFERNEPMNLEVLVGKTIVAATKAGDLLFVATDGGSFRLEPRGDCCSHCYVQHVSGTDALKAGAIVASVEDIESEPTDVEKADADVLDGWGHRITTDKGVCSIEMRLSHNGYYGGSLDVESFEGELPGSALDDF